MKKLLLLSILASVFTISSAQVTFSHSIGGAYYLSSDISLGCPAIVYSPRVNFLEFGDEATLSFGTHLGLGLYIDTEVGSDIVIAYDIPVVAEINLGQGAHNDTRSLVGFFAGLGFGFNKIASTDTYSTYRNKAIGAVFNLGLRAEVYGQPCGFRLSYLKNTVENNFDVIGAEFFYTIGYR